MQDALNDNELFIYEESGEIISAMRVNHEPADGYEKVTFGLDLPFFEQFQP